MRVLHVAETIKGGIATYLDELVPLQIQRYGIDGVRLVVPESQVGQLRVVPSGVIATYPDSGRRLANAGVLFRRTSQVVAQFKPTVVHAHSTFAGLAVRMWRLTRFVGRKVAIIYTPHGWAFYRDAGIVSTRAAVWLERMLAPLADAIVCVSNHEFKIAADHGLPPGRLKVVLNGIGEAELPEAGESIVPVWPTDRGRTRVLFVGRFDRQKGIDRLADILDRLGGGVFACIIGEPVTSDAEPPKFGDNARLLGWVRRNDVGIYMKSADLLIIPSRWEGLCLVGIEALRAGKAVFASRIGGMEDIVEDGVNGRLLDGVDGFVARIRDIPRVELEAMGRKGRERYEAMFRIDRVMEQLSAIYAACATGRPRLATAISNKDVE